MLFPCTAVVAVLSVTCLESAFVVSDVGVAGESPTAAVPTPGAPGVAGGGAPPTNDTPPIQKKTVEVVVSATRSERSAGEVPVSLTIVPRKHIETTPARNLDDVLRTVPGLNLPLGSSNGIQPTTNLFSMRGLGGSRALVLLDGVPLNDALTGYIQWNRAPLGIVERVEVTRGAGASLFGNYSLGGTVSIQSRRLSEPRLEAEAAYGSFDTYRLATSVTGKVLEGVDGGLFVDFEDTDGYIRTPPEERGLIDIPSSSRSVNVLGKLETRSDGPARGFLRANVLDHDLGQGTPLSNNSRRIYDAAAGGTLRLGRSELTASAFFLKSEYRVENATLVPGAGRDAEYQSGISDRPGRDLGANLQWTLGPGGPLTFVTVGLDVRRVLSDETNWSYDRTGKQTGVRTSEGSQTFAGLFAETSFLPIPRLEVLLSARLDVWRNAGGREGSVPGATTDYESKDTTQLDPRLALRYEVSDAVAVRGAVYRAFRAPNLAELYRSTTSRGFTVLANPALGAETLVGGDLGVDLKVGRVSGQLNLFRNEVDGIIVRSTVAPSTVQSVNLGAARSQGLEAMGRVGLSESLSVEAGYAFTDSVVTDNPPNPAIVGNRVPDVPRHSGSLAVRYGPPSGLSAVLRARALSQRFGDDTNQLATDSHLVVDAFVSYPVLPLLEVFVSGENLLDRRYVSDTNIGRRLGPPVGVFAGLRFRQKLGRGR